jgi:hypothetical protein
MALTNEEKILNYYQRGRELNDLIDGVPFWWLLTTKLLSMICTLSCYFGLILGVS